MKTLLLAALLFSPLTFAAPKSDAVAELDAQIQTHRDAVKKLQSQKKAIKAKERLAKAEQKLADLKAQIANAE